MDKEVDTPITAIIPVAVEEVMGTAEDVVVPRILGSPNNLRSISTQYRLISGPPWLRKKLPFKK
jgi:hypothetical protein